MDDRPPRRRLRRLAVTAGGLLLALAAAAWFAPVLVAKTSLRQIAIDRALADLRGRATATEASLGWRSPVVLTGVTVTDPAGEVVLTADALTTSKTLLQLARDPADLGTFTFVKPVVRLVCRPGGTNFEALIAGYTADDGSPPKPARTAVRFAVEGGRLVQTEPGVPGEVVLDPVDVTFAVPADRAEPMTLDLKATAGGTLAAEFALGSPLAGKLTATKFPLDAVGPVVRRFSPGTRATGELTADLSGTAGDAAALHGRTGVTGLSLEAAWLGPDPVRQAAAELTVDVSRAGDELDVRWAELTADAGTVKASGRLPLDGTAEEYAGRAGLTAAADVDLARLAAVVPRLLRLRPGTALTAGKLTVNLQSVAAAAGTRWEGTVGTTAVRGTRDGKPLAWDQPLSAGFVGHFGPDKKPVFDKLEARTDFAAVAAKGNLQQFTAAANLDLDRLAARLGEFVDLGGMVLKGRAEVQANGQTAAGGRFAVAGKADLKQFTVTDAQGRGLAEPEATVTARASGVRTADALRLDVGEMGVQAAGDELKANLLAPVADLKTARTGKASATLTGDLGRWRQRLAAFVTIPAGWEITGSGTATGTTTLTDAGLTAAPVEATVRQARFRGAGVDLTEPTLTVKAGTLTWDRATNGLSLADAKLTCDTVTATAAKLDVLPAVQGTVQVAGELARLTGPLKLPTPVAGKLSGTVGVDTRTATAFTADLKAEQFVYGPSGKPTWREPWVTLAGAGEYVGDSLKLRTLTVARDGASVEAAGALDALSATPTVNLAGTLSCDLAKLEPQLKDHLGAGATVRGQGKKPFRLTGPVGGALDRLAGEAAVGWQAVKAYGFDVGPAELTATLSKGVLDLSPVKAGFGGGTVTVDPAIDLRQPDAPLVFAPGTIIDHARLTPQATAGALGYALPAIANAARADGTVSLQLDDGRLPVADPAAGTLRGKLLLHDANLSAGPVFARVLQLLDAKTTEVVLAKEQVVPVALDKGRVYHDNFALTFGQTVVKSKGSVGVADQSLQMELELPIPPRAIDGVLRNNPRLLEALKKQRVRVPVRGTLSKPDLDERAFFASAGEVVRKAGKDATRDLLGDVLRGAIPKKQ
jgi:hypothetical protein